MVVKQFEIFRDHPTRSEDFYMTGETVTGKVYIIIGDEAELTSEVVVRFFGECHLAFDEEDWAVNFGEGKPDTTAVAKQSKETYFDLYVRVFGDGLNQIKLTPGEHTFPYSFKIPNFPLPVSIQHKEVWVDYGLLARIRKPVAEDDPKTVILPVHIRTPLNLNTVEEVRSPLVVQESLVNVSTTKGIWCCAKSGEIDFGTLEASILKRGFCPGEEIPLSVAINIPVKHDLFVELHRTVHFGYDQKYLRDKTEVLVTVESNGRAKGSSQWNVPDFVVPQTPPTSPEAVTGPQLTYEIVVMCKRAKPAYWETNEWKLQLPIVVGTEPLKDN